MADKELNRNYKDRLSDDSAQPGGGNLLSLKRRAVLN